MSLPTSSQKAHLDSHMVAEQALMEQSALQHVKQALRIALNWQVDRDGISRKLSSVRFMAQSLERHLERLMQLEEEGGYLQVVADEKPYLCNKLPKLLADHDRFRFELRDLMTRLKISTEGDDRFEEVYRRLTRLLSDIDAHEQSEQMLVQEVLLQDDGGEG